MDSNSMILLDPVQAISDSKARKDIVLQMYREHILVQGADYGVIPGTTKPTLLKPGAERLCSAFHLDPFFDTVTAVEDFDKPLFFYRIRCHLFHVETRLEVATGIGSCNSMESKYRWRTSKQRCPSCDAEAIIKSKYPDRQTGKIGFYCRECKSNYDPDDRRITGQEAGRVPNDDVFSIVNTIDKMAQKRALISAVLIATNASEFFTQDLEDMPGFGVQYGEDIIVTTPSPDEPPQQQPTQQPPIYNAPPPTSDDGTQIYTCERITVLPRKDGFQYIAHCDRKVNIVTYTREKYRAAFDMLVDGWNVEVTPKGKVIPCRPPIRLKARANGANWELVEVLKD